MSTGKPTTWIKAVIMVMSAAMFITLFVPAEAEAKASAKSPCPHYAIQDVFADRYGDWDHDRMANITELYNGFNPCLNDSARYCATNAWNCTALIAQNPCAVTDYHYYGYSYDGYYYYTPLTSWTWAHINSDPNGDWDKDGVSNHAEAKAGANPCLKPCPNPSKADLALNPNGDWDRDRVSNTTEIAQGTDPCNKYSYYSQRLPHVDAPYVQIDKPAPGYQCPYGYPYYHPATGLCYANPVGNHTYW